jgi:hypothetical protein
MTNKSKAKGDNAEREVQNLLRRLLVLPRIRRALGAGRRDDVGDIDGVPSTVVQVADWARPLVAIDTKLPEVEQQRLNARKPFGVLFIRRVGGKYVVVMSPEQFVKMLKYARLGLASTRAAKSSKMSSRGNGRRGST